MAEKRPDILFMVEKSLKIKPIWKLRLWSHLVPVPDYDSRWALTWKRPSSKYSHNWIRALCSMFWPCTQGLNDTWVLGVPSQCLNATLFCAGVRATVLVRRMYPAIPFQTNLVPSVFLLPRLFCSREREDRKGILLPIQYSAPFWHSFTAIWLIIPFTLAPRNLMKPA